MILFVRNFIEKVQKHETFYDTIWLGYFIIELFGLSPVHLWGSNKTPTSKKIPYALMATLVIEIGVLYLNIHLDIDSTKTESFILRNGLRWIMIIGSILIIIITVKNAALTKKSAELLVAIHEFDITLKNAGHQIDLKTQCRWFIFMTLFSTVFFASFLVLSGVLMFFAMKITSFTGQHMFYFYALQYRFKAMNHYICELLPTESELVTKFRRFHLTKNRYVLTKRIQQLADIHHCLIQIVNRYNKNYGLQLFLTHIGTSNITILSWFSLYRLLLSPDMDSLFIWTTNFCWSSYYIVYQLFITILGSLVSLEGKRMGVLVHKALELVVDEYIREKLLLFSNQLYQRNPVITSGMIDFNATLIFSTIGAITTYAAILIQFDFTNMKTCMKLISEMT
ncbi:uncharacterized protein LOC129774056 [Toxorhynchites rutilus septentrionalis]|uniref:uncharacterized protein LOC129774056 n=1 Tax=Toxorhynchites rutilus septentrionalis TaxID=329112 RepID=UPI0024798DD0|nr:uncharacterized protein LOC129774056 [Toxorhynchites rutilus septentrionalis]